MDCECQTRVRFDGDEARQYARRHLTQTEVDSANGVTRYTCPTTGMVWQMDSPQSELQGGGPPRLRRVLGTAGPFTRLGNAYVSDEGFSVEVLGRTGLLYEEGPRRMKVNSEILLGPEGMVIYPNSAMKWNAPYDHEPVDSQKRLAIVDNIRRAFRSDGFEIHVQWPARKQYFSLDNSGDYPTGANLYYECLRCGSIIDSLSRKSRCVCGNVSFTAEGRVAIEVKESVKLLSLSEGHSN